MQPLQPAKRTAKPSAPSVAPASVPFRPALEPAGETADTGSAASPARRMLSANGSDLAGGAALPSPVPSSSARGAEAAAPDPDAEEASAAPIQQAPSALLEVHQQIADGAPTASSMELSEGAAGAKEDPTQPVRESKPEERWPEHAASLAEDTGPVGPPDQPDPTLPSGGPIAAAGSSQRSSPSTAPPHPTTAPPVPAPTIPISSIPAPDPVAQPAEGTSKCWPAPHAACLAVGVHQHTPKLDYRDHSSLHVMLHPNSTVGHAAGGETGGGGAGREARLARLVEQLRRRLDAAQAENQQLEDMLRQADARVTGVLGLQMGMLRATARSHSSCCLS